ncbi:MAG: GyrI-like domain-containing protein [Bacteroidota bacterium]
MKRKAGWFLLLILAGLGVWYFGFKKEHYQISFESKQPAGVVYHHILGWHPESTPGVDSITTIEKTPYSLVEQRVVAGDSIFTYRWEMRKKDSMTRVTVKITDMEHGLMQKVQAPFANNDFVKRSISNVKMVGDVLAKSDAKFKVHSIKDTIFPSRYCAYLPLRSTVANKSATMLHSIVDIMGFIKQNDIPLTGDPYLEVTQWNQQKDSIHFNFCFPIAQSDSIPKTDRVLFKETPSFEAVKAEFNGNYSISDKAWYYLLEYAERKGYSVKNTPTELFLNDPHTSGRNSIDWKANIYLPLDKQDGL